MLDKFGQVIDEVGGTEPFEKGLYGSTEMFADGFRHLYNHGILKRAVYSDAGLQRLVNAGLIGPEVTPGTLARWWRWACRARLTPDDLAFLQKFGILDEAVVLDGSVLRCPDGTEIAADLGDADALEQIGRHCLGTELKGGSFCMPAFSSVHRPCTSSL